MKKKSISSTKTFGYVLNFVLVFIIKVLRMYTKEMIQSKLSNDIIWMERALVVLYRFQTEDEQETGYTSSINKRGFNSSDSKYLTYCSKYILNGGHLSGKHLIKCSKMLPKYWKQIKMLIESRQ